MDEDNENISRALEEDFYTFLNVPREASTEDITNAYRRLSRLYHPDKHVEPERKKDAELLFHKTKRAYEVLSDPHKRAIYDSLGTTGLETEGWEIVQRTKTPQEIREEYERLAREREEKRLQQRVNPRGNVTINVNATEMFAQYDEEDDYNEFGLPPMEIAGISMSLSTEAPMTLRNKVTIGGQVSTHNGTGNGALTLTGRRLLEDNKWVEADLSVGSGVALNFRHFRYFSRRIFGTGTLQFHFTDIGVRAGCETTFAMQMDEHTVGYLTWRAGLSSAMVTTIAHNRENFRVEGSVSLGIPHSFISFNYSYNFKQMKLKMATALKAGTFGALMEYSAEKQVSEQSSMSASVMVGVPTGVRLKIKFVRASHTFIIPIHLCEEPMPSPVFYATVVPLIAYVVIKRVVIDPIMTEQKEREKEKQKQANKKRMAEMKREATAAVNLMRETFSRIRSDEESHKGLVIVRALYGPLATLSVPADRDKTDVDEIIDVTIPLQCLVKDAKLILHDASKSQLPGFYDPCVGEDKALYVQYLHKSHQHEIVSPDNEPLRIPKQSHRVSVT